MTGSRDCTDRPYVFWTLDYWDGYAGPITEIICGVDPYQPQGTDKLAWEWALERGRDRKAFRAAWTTHGKKAGPMRNSEMAAYGAELLAAGDEVRCMSFPGGTGTADMTDKARRKGIKVIEVAPRKRSSAECDATMRRARAD